ncbi:MAG: acyltransferase [Dehalococcoidia bacterium]|nr:acyltransferase [Dehalococcoidia bacterium]
MESTNIEGSDSIAPSPTRRYDIDWLRLMAVFLLFFFHTARIFDPWEDFYVHNDLSSPLLSYIFIQSLWPWHMSLFFLLAGASTYFALRHRNRGQYVKERFKRLFIPFLVMGLILIPPQSYLGLLSHSAYSESFFTWYPNFFTLQSEDMDGYFMGGYTWGHLWFIIHLFIYSLIALPIFLYLKGESGRRLISWLARAFTKPGVIFLFPVLLVLISEFPEIAGGNPLFYITFFICGFLLMSDYRFADTIDRQRFVLLILGPVILAGILVTGSTNNWPVDMPNWADNMVDAYVDAFVPWFVILAVLAYGRRLLQFTNRFLKYFAEGAYPLYILHQTIIVIIGFYVVQWDIAVAAKFTVIVTLSLASTVLIYDLVVRRTAITRFLFGMKPRVKKRLNRDFG